MTFILDIYQALNSPQKQEATLMFCSPFRRRRRRRVEEVEERQLSREEAWHLYLAKLEEEANYFSVSESSEETELCTCQTCIVSGVDGVDGIGVGPIMFLLSEYESLLIFTQ